MNTLDLLNKGYDLDKLAYAFFTMSNDSFFSKYNFNWIPVEPYYTRARNKIDKEFEYSRNIKSYLTGL